MNINNQELDAFLIETELVHEKVKALMENRVSPEQFDRVEKLRSEDKRRKEEAKVRRERENHEMKLRGRDGKGIGKDFVHFCRRCHKEYELPTQMCLKCNSPTMTLEDRQKQLQVMVGDYKAAKHHRNDRKQKWDMWQKTQAMLTTKNNFNYNRWDYFVSDSEEEQDQDPIVPKNDPNFKALEMDIEERKKRRNKDQQNAQRLKDKGNAAMSNQNYQQAMEMYTLALEHSKQIKAVYTNRALAFIKLHRYSKAVKDCTNVIEYMEVFEKETNKDLLFKAFLRRAIARQELKDYSLALQDINQALAIFPLDNQCKLMQKQIISFLQHTKNVQQILTHNKSNQVQQSEEKDSKQIERQIIKELAQEQLTKQQQLQQPQEIKQTKELNKKQIIYNNPIQQIKELLLNIDEKSVTKLLQLMYTDPKLKDIFVSGRGIQICLEQMMKEQTSKKQALLIVNCLNGDGVGQKRVSNFGTFKIYDKIQDLLKEETKLNFQKYELIQDLFEILVAMSLYEPHRISLASSINTYTFIEIIFAKLITKHKKHTHLFQIVLLYISNLCCGESLLKNKYIENVKVFFDSLYVMVLETKTNNRGYQNLKKAVYSLFANLVTKPQHRRSFLQSLHENNRFIQLKEQIENYPRSKANFKEYMDSILTLLVNASLDTQIASQLLAQPLFIRFLKAHHDLPQDLVYKALLVLSRFAYSSNAISKLYFPVFDCFITQNIPPLKHNMVQIVKILNVLCSLKHPSELKELSPKMMKCLDGYIGANDNHEVLFCNTSNLFGIILGWKEERMRNCVLHSVKTHMKRLVEISKEKTGNWRKSAAILIAKCSNNPQCRQQMQQHHAMDVLKSIAGQVIQ